MGAPRDGPTGTVALATVLGGRSRCVRVSHGYSPPSSTPVTTTSVPPMLAR